MGKSTNIQQTADVLTEAPIIVFFGIIPFIVRPMTMAQMYEIGGLVENIEKLEIEGDFNPIVRTLEQFKDIRICSDVVVRMVFRTRLMRFLFGWYVRHNLTMAKYKRIIEFGATTFKSAFFLTSLSFLVGIKQTTKPTNTAEANPRGDLSEE